MAAKRKRKRARTKASSTPRKKRRSIKRRRAHAKAKASPIRRKRRRSAARRAAPRRTRRRAAASSRARASNPSFRRRRSGRRRARRNPSLPIWAEAGLAAGLAVLAFAGVTAGTFAVTQRLDPSGATVSRNRYIAGGLATLGGLALATKSPLLGAGVAAGALVAVAGSAVGIKLTTLLQPKPAAIGAVYGQMGAVYGQMGAYQPVGMGAYQQVGMGAVYGQMGDAAAFVPASPYAGRHPFG